MKIRVVFTLDIPDEGVDAWMLEYGVERGEVRDDIRTYVRNQVQECTGAQVAGWDVNDTK